MKQDTSFSALGSSTFNCLHHLLEAQVEQAPDAIAIVSEDQQLTYQALNTRANQLAHLLQERGVGPEVLVGIYIERSIEMVIALLGILKAGGAYVPIDPTFPPERIAFLLQDAQVPVLLTQERLVERLPKGEEHWHLGDEGGSVYPHLLRLDTDWAMLRQPLDNPQSGVQADNLAYVMYTSGSTGKPKGVQILHQAVVNVLSSLQTVFRLERSDRLLAVTTMSFDISVLELFLPLLVGACVIVASKQDVTDGTRLLKRISQEQITVMQATPTTWRLVLAAGWSDAPFLKHILCGGEALPYELGVQLAQHLTEQGRLYNLYGPTEATIWSMVSLVQPACPITLGEPIANTQIFVLSKVPEEGEPLQSVAPGEAGEIYIGGVCLARGYLNRPELMKEKFLLTRAGLLYRTGDRARVQADGGLCFVGRLDSQVKLHGLRIELGEIESALRQYSGIEEAVVLVQEERLEAYLQTGHPLLSLDDLREFLSKWLPDYMVPTVFWTVTAFPRTPNQKTDRTALRGSGQALRAGAAPPRDTSPWLSDQAESQVVDRCRSILMKILDIPVLDPWVALVDAGMDSLRATQCANHLAAHFHLDPSFVLRILSSTATLHDVGMAMKTALLLREHASSKATLPDVPAQKKAERERSVLAFRATEHRSLFDLICRGQVSPIDAAALTYLPAEAIGQQAMVEHWCHGRPVLTHIIHTWMGRIGLFALPLTAQELFTSKGQLLSQSTDALALAARAGAQCVSLTGLLPSALEGGWVLARAIEEQSRLPKLKLTTGHAVTTAALVLNIAALLEQTGRTLRKEVLACVGMGSIGRATLLLMLKVLPHPQQILLCDVFSKRVQLEQVQIELRQSGYQGTIHLLSAPHGAVPGEVYCARVLVGATNVANVLDIRRIRPGSLLIDDSAPHCFDAHAALARMKEKQDILAIEGGELHLPPFVPDMQEVQYLPNTAHAPTIEALLHSTELFGLRDESAREIMGCVFSGVLTQTQHLPPTLGLVPPEVSQQFYEALLRLEMGAAAFHLEHERIATDHIAAFRHGFERMRPWA